MLEPDKLRHHYESLTDEDLARHHGLGPSAFASAAVWQIIDEVYRARSTPGQEVPVRRGAPTMQMSATEMRDARRDAALMTDSALLQLLARGSSQWTPQAWEILQDELERRNAAGGADIATASESTARMERRTYVSLLVLGVLGFFLFGPMECAVLRQSEGQGMAVAFLIIPLAIPFVVAVLCALVFSALGLADGSDSLRWRLLLWYGCAALFTLQLVLLDRKAGGDRFSSGTVMLFAVLGFASLVATVTLPGWWLARHPPGHPGSRVS